MKTVEIKGSRSSWHCTVPETWEPIKALGAGAYASVTAFRGPDGTEFACKKVDKVFSHGILALRTLREIRLLAHFRHPNVLSIRELFLQGSETSPDCYVCLEIMDGDLHNLIHHEKAPLLGEFQVQCILYQILRGLLCLRRAQVLHRDLKPGNILVRSGGDVKIADLGLGRKLEDNNNTDHDDLPPVVLTEYVVTRFYRAPEVVLTATKYTYAMDMWSVGCILGEMLTQKALFQGRHSLDQVKVMLIFLERYAEIDKSWIPRDSPAWNYMEKCMEKRPQADKSERPPVELPQDKPEATDLLMQMLRFNPERRISVEDALYHPYVETFDARSDPEVAAAEAVIPIDWSFDRKPPFDGEGKVNLRELRNAFSKAAKLVAVSSEAVAGGAAVSNASPRTPTRSPRNGAVPDESPPGTAAPARVQTPWGRRWQKRE